jgi:ATP-dependent Clp protease ATP-binding subunit ClpC
VLIDAANHAREAGSALTEIDHLWLAVSRAEGAVARRILSDLGRLCHLQRLCGGFPA